MGLETESSGKLELIAITPMDGNAPDQRSRILDILKTEIDREMAALRDLRDPAHYLAYEIVEQRIVNLIADGGELTIDDDATTRNLDVEVRVGSPAVDSTRSVVGDTNNLNVPLTRRGVMPLGDDEKAISNVLWIETDRRYREASNALGYVRQDVATLNRNPGVQDFATSPVEVFVAKPAALEFDKSKWIERLRRCSKAALAGRTIRAQCQVVFEAQTVYFVNSEGTLLQQSSTRAEISLSLGAAARDGSKVSRLRRHFARTPDDLPSESVWLELVATTSRELDALYEAPAAEPYIGPVIFDGQASAAFFHEVLGHRIEGDRLKDQATDETFTSYLGKSLAPAWLSAFDDPLITTLDGVPLNGFYRFDNEGVRARRVQLIEKGVLTGFATSRNPIASFPASSGHGRRSPSLRPTARQANLVVTADKTVPRVELEKMLIAEVERQHRPFGMIVTEIRAAEPSAFEPQAFTLNPSIAYRLYPDGRREVVRGSVIRGNPVAALQGIRAASRERAVVNDMCGAESGWLPVSTSAPGVLVEQLELDKLEVAGERPFVLPAPPLEDAP